MQITYHSKCNSTAIRLATINTGIICWECTNMKIPNNLFLFIFTGYLLWSCTHSSNSNPPSMDFFLLCQEFCITHENTTTTWRVFVIFILTKNAMETHNYNNIWPQKSIHIDLGVLYIYKEGFQNQTSVLRLLL